MKTRDLVKGLIDMVGRVDDPRGYIGQAATVLNACAPKRLHSWMLKDFDGAVFVEYRHDSIRDSWALYGGDSDGFARFGDANGRFALPYDEYGVTWRAWTARPDETADWSDA